MDKKRDSFSYETLPGAKGKPPLSRRMPKPIKMLAGGTMLLFLFLVFQIMRSPKVISAPGGREKIDDMVRDPNLDRMYNS